MVKMTKVIRSGSDVAKEVVAQSSVQRDGGSEFAAEFEQALQSYKPFSFLLAALILDWKELEPQVESLVSAASEFPTIL